MDNANETIPRSRMGIEGYNYQAHKEMEKGNLIDSMKLFNRVVDISEHHLENAPYSSPTDVADAHRKAASVKNEIIAKLNGANNVLEMKYTTESVNHIIRATQLA
mmetsp:Transcript_25915/g.30535  ORF Transcript_25915/g.30535 Transcript_25915/m.30535 type:complete len:105 (+) Transcript_25915:98-412(+)|eukprot:CAMPEP_0198254970 /NCGR_PEP_ID=MMETSP1447-20131203/5207_1 /TAXON_ID=420782 /ORGANISM="Chaetoceros dichaeta, Strain CCMP1751" /LENGTH=104 /DNA_ID=CAMNT_0043941229 /DNA_START=112 /DNA_END=426 /DNA_ORIENTATION=-